ncbi:MAG TPA: hypothetical protein VME17_09780 [Bryobacteraceae bacterium]|nr:hypothetical protein [Bryobacteraceae bacterium]
MTNLSEIRAALDEYLSDASGVVELPMNLLAILEDPDEATKEVAEQIEAIIGFYSINRIHKDLLKEQLRELLDLERVAPHGTTTALATSTSTKVNMHEPLDERVFVSLFQNATFDVVSHGDPLWGNSPGGSMQTGYVFLPFSMVVTRNYYDNGPVSRILFDSESPKSDRSYSVELLPAA